MRTNNVQVLYSLNKGRKQEDLNERKLTRGRKQEEVKNIHRFFQTMDLVKFKKDFMENWRTHLLQKREEYLKLTYPAATCDHGIPLPPRYEDRTANGLTRCVCDFLKYCGFYSNRINSTGLPRKQADGTLKWTKSSTRKGVADISAIIGGKSISIEIKIGKDRMSEAQHHEKARVEAAGGVYIVVKSMDQFFAWYTSFMA